MDVFEKAKLLATKYKGDCQSNSYSICKGKNSLKFKCLNGHIFFMPVEDIESANLSSKTINLNSVNGVATSSSICQSSADWCYKCLNFF